MSRTDGLKIGAGTASWQPFSLAALLAFSLASLILLVFLAVYNLEHIPATWFDEGMNLHVPKTLVQYGVYADLSSEGFRYFGATTALGPTVMLPIALAFKLVGVGLLQARLVMVAYMLATVVVFFLVALRQFGWTAAYVACLLLVSTPGMDFVYYGRQVLGEVPALGFLLLGTYFWHRAVDSDGKRLLLMVWAGVGFGLAAVTKPQYGLILLPSMLLMLALDRYYYRELGIRVQLIPIVIMPATMIASQVIQLLPLLVAQDASSTLALLKESSAGSILLIAPDRMLSSLRFLSSPDVFAYWAAPAVVYGFVLARTRTRAGQKNALLLAFSVLGLGWFAFGSIGWPRYAFPWLAIVSYFVAKLFTDLISGNMGGRPIVSSSQRIRAITFTLVLVMVIGYPLQGKVRSITSNPDLQPQQVADYLNEHVPATEVMETWEPELGFLTNHNFHYPSMSWLDRANRAKWLGAKDLINGYDSFLELRPSYLVVGRFAKYTGIYTYYLSRSGQQPMVSVDDYDIYRLK